MNKTERVFEEAQNTTPKELNCFEEASRRSEQREQWKARNEFSHCRVANEHVRSKNPAFPAASLRARRMWGNRYTIAMLLRRSWTKNSASSASSARDRV